MKNLITNIACVFLSLTLVAGCQSTDQTANTKTSHNGSTNNTAFRITEPTNVVILFGPPTNSYIKLGGVSYYKVGADPAQTWQDSFQKQAGAQGADAVIVDTSTLNNKLAPLINGTAIRYQ